MPPTLTVLRYAVLAAFGLAVLAGVASWLVRTRTVSPFSALGRFLRSTSDVVILPVERRLVRMGGNPMHAGIWLAVVVAIVGILIVSLAQWAVNTGFLVSGAVQGGPRSIAVLVVRAVYNILVFAIFVRVIASWFGAFAYNRWVRWAYVLTDWIVDPIRRVLPTFGPLDISPLAAWFVLFVVQRILVSILLA
ncbi:MAG TPA: YggT family protein [Gemmatimonadales bacterium]